MTLVNLSRYRLTTAVVNEQQTTVLVPKASWFDLLRSDTDDKLLDRIVLNICKDDPDDDSSCWPWQAAINKQGYGLLRIGREMVYAHHLLLAIELGGAILHYAETESGFERIHVSHSCCDRDLSCIGTPSCRHRRCTNAAEHVELLTQGENVRRAAAKRALRKQLAAVA